MRVVHNGVADAEFLPVKTAPDATDLVFVGELRKLKGVDVLIEAIARLARDGRNAHRHDRRRRRRPRARSRRRSPRTSSPTRSSFVGAKPARAAFALGRLLVVPSRAESLPYIVLEAAAAGLPIIATNVGGIPEIFGPDADELVPPGDPAALADAIAHGHAGPRRAALGVAAAEVAPARLVLGRCHDRRRHRRLPRGAGAPQHG